MDSLVDACEILLQLKKNLTTKSRKEKRKTSQKLSRKKRKQKTGFYIPQPLEKITHAASKIQAARPPKFTKSNIYYKLYILKH